jgi:hypothetical protein
MKSKLITILILCFCASIMLSAKKCGGSGGGSTKPATTFPPTPAAVFDPKNVKLKDFIISSEYGAAYNAMIASCNLMTDPTTKVKTQVIYYDASGNEVIFNETNTVGGITKPAGLDYQYTVNLPQNCEYFLRTTLTAASCQDCCGYTFQENLGSGGVNGCPSCFSCIPQKYEKGKPVIEYESVSDPMPMHGSGGFIEMHI